MKTTRSRFTHLLCAATSVGVLCGTAGAQPRYDFNLVDAFTPDYGLRETYLWDISDTGVACGTTNIQIGSMLTYTGFTWTTLGKTPIPVSWPHGVNNVGLVVGNLSVYNRATGQSFYPPLLPGTYIGPNFSSVNDAGVAVGMIQTCNCSNSAGTLQIPYVWDAVGGARTVAVPNAKGLSRINSAGVAIGWTGGNSSADGFFVDIATGAYTLMESVFPSSVGIPPTRAYDINDRGAIVGTRQGSAAVYLYGYVYSPATGVQILPFPTAAYQQAVKPFGINNAGTIVGEIYISGSSRAFVYSAARGIRDLNDPTLVAGIPPGFTLMTAQKINDPGWIVGYGYGGGGMYKAYVLTPVHSGDLNGDGLVNAVDATTFVSVLTGLDVDPAHVADSDLNGDGTANGGDIELFVRALLR